MAVPTDKALYAFRVRNCFYCAREVKCALIRQYQRYERLNQAQQDRLAEKLPVWRNRVGPCREFQEKE